MIDKSLQIFIQNYSTCPPYRTPNGLENVNTITVSVQTWTLNQNQKRKIQTNEIKCLRNVVNKTKIKSEIWTPETPYKYSTNRTTETEMA
jgi:hypothetical protein